MRESFVEILGPDYGHSEDAQERAEWALLGRWDAGQYAQYPLAWMGPSVQLSRENVRHWDRHGAPADLAQQHGRHVFWRAELSKLLADNRAALGAVLWQLVVGRCWTHKLEQPHQKLERSLAEAANIAAKFGVTEFPETLADAHALAQRWDWVWMRHQAAAFARR